VFSFMGPGRLGVRLQSLGDQLGAYFGAADGHGALIAEVEKGTAAEKAGLKAGDVIVGVAGKDVEDPGDVVDAIHEADEGPVKITILRDRKRMTVTADLPARRGSGDEADFSVMAPGVAPGELLPPHAPYVHVGPGASWIGAPPAGVVAPAPPEMRWIRAPVAPGAVPALPALPAVPPRWTRFVNRYI
jgi:membrane-associated protease RseP (regulator of RpoE activity)